jgi:hypothetical protein
MSQQEPGTKASYQIPPPKYMIIKYPTHVWNLYERIEMQDQRPDMYFILLGYI